MPTRLRDCLDVRAASIGANYIDLRPRDENAPTLSPLSLTLPLPRLSAAFPDSVRVEDSGLVFLVQSQFDVPMNAQTAQIVLISARCRGGGGSAFDRLLQRGWSDPPPRRPCLRITTSSAPCKSVSYTSLEHRTRHSARRRRFDTVPTPEIHAPDVIT